MSYLEFPGKAGRFLFKENEPYAGRLIAVTERPIGNTDRSVALLRLEFEIYFVDGESEPVNLHPTGGVASQDIVVTAKALSDRGLKRYAAALRVDGLDERKNWYELESRAQTRTLKNQTWICIWFGKPDADRDFRQPFTDMQAMASPLESQIDRSSTSEAVRDVFQGPEQVRHLLRNRRNQAPSVDTVNKFVDQHERRYKDALVVRSPGGRRAGNRRINWYLCWHLWEAEREAGTL